MTRPAEGERRATARAHSGECGWITIIRLRPGRDATLIDLSEGGAQVEASSRMLPGTSVELLLGAEGWRRIVIATVLRCSVSALIPDQGVRYRAGLMFDTGLHLPALTNGYEVPVLAAGESDGEGSNYPASGPAFWLVR